MFYDLTNIQGIKVIVPPSSTTYIILANAPTLVGEVSFVLEVNQLVNVADTITMEEVPSSPIPTNRG